MWSLNIVFICGWKRQVPPSLVPKRFSLCTKGRSLCFPPADNPAHPQLLPRGAGHHRHHRPAPLRPQKAKQVPSRSISFKVAVIAWLHLPEVQLGLDKKSHPFRGTVYLGQPKGGYTPLGRRNFRSSRRQFSVSLAAD